MKKIKTILASLSSMFLPFVAFAQMELVAEGGPDGVAVDDIDTLIDSITNLGGLVFGAIAVISFLIAGILFLTSAGDPEKIKMARTAFLWGVAGVVVGIIAFSIISIVGSFVT